MGQFFNDPVTQNIDLVLSADDYAEIISTQEESSAYEPADNRPNPFTGSYICNLIANKTFSTYLNKQIETVQEAAWHGKYETELWAQQDIANKIERLRVQNNNRVKAFRARQNSNVNPTLEAAKTKIKDAIAQRDAVVLQWNTYISQLKHEYNVVKLNSSKGVKNDQ